MGCFFFFFLALTLVCITDWNFVGFVCLHTMFHERWWLLAVWLKSLLSIGCSHASTYGIGYVVGTMLAMPNSVHLPYHLRALPRHLTVFSYATYIFYISKNCRYRISALYLPKFSFWSFSTLPALCSWITESVFFYPIFMQFIDMSYTKCATVARLSETPNSNILLPSQSVNYNTSLKHTL